MRFMTMSKLGKEQPEHPIFRSSAVLILHFCNTTDDSKVSAHMQPVRASHFGQHYLNEHQAHSTDPVVGHESCCRLQKFPWIAESLEVSTEYPSG